MHCNDEALLFQSIVLFLPVNALPSVLFAKVLTEGSISSCFSSPLKILFFDLCADLLMIIGCMEELLMISFIDSSISLLFVAKCAYNSLVLSLSTVMHCLYSFFIYICPRTHSDILAAGLRHASHDIFLPLYRYQSTKTSTGDSLRMDDIDIFSILLLFFAQRNLCRKNFLPSGSAIRVRTLSATSSFLLGSLVTKIRFCFADGFIL